LTNLKERIVWWEDTHHVWVVNWYRYQAGTKSNPNFAIAAKGDLSVMPPKIIEEVCKKYPELSPSVTHPKPLNTPSKPGNNGSRNGAYQGVSNPLHSPSIAPTDFLHSPLVGVSEDIPTPSIASTEGLSRAHHAEKSEAKRSEAKISKAKKSEASLVQTPREHVREEDSSLASPSPSLNVSASKADEPFDHFSELTKRELTESQALTILDGFDSVRIESNINLYDSAGNGHGPGWLINAIEKDYASDRAKRESSTTRQGAMREGDDNPGYLEDNVNCVDRDGYTDLKKLEAKSSRDLSQYALVLGHEKKKGEVVDPEH
jgi:hypothetical protein